MIHLREVGFRLKQGHLAKGLIWKKYPDTAWVVWMFGLCREGQMLW